MRERPFFSVVILAYQVAPYIGECLESVLMQNFQDFEILLVNPYSADGTDGICESYARRYSRIRWIRIQNRGQLLNRIAGYEEAQGAYLLTLDGDDWWERTLLEEVHRAVLRDGCDMAFFEFQSVRDGKQQPPFFTFPDGRSFSGKEKRLLYEKMIGGNRLNEIWRKAVRREVYERIKEDFSDCETMRKGEDFLYSLYILREAETVTYLPLALYNYRFREDSANHRFRAEELDDLAKKWTHLERMINEWGMNEKRYYDLFCRTAARSYMDFIGRCCLERMPYARRKEIFGRLRRDPFYCKSAPYQNRKDLPLQRFLFVWLFQRGDLPPALYGSLLRILKRGKTICGRRKRQ